MAMGDFRVGRHSIGENHPAFIIAEIAQAHDGSLGFAHSYIDAATRAGASAVKFQTHIAEAESTPQEPWRVKFSSQDESRFTYWKRMEFSHSQWKELKTHCDSNGIVFLSSPFSIEAVDLLEQLGVPAWKIGSGETTNLPLFRRISQTKLPVFLSTGMSQLEEIDEAVKSLRASQLPFALLQCTSLYPTPPEKIGLNVLRFYRERYDCIVGLSDHSSKVATSLAAASLGAKVIEVHLTLSREMFGPDVSSSLTSAELKDLVDGVRWIENILAHPVDKNEMAEELSPMKRLFEKSLVANRNLSAGTKLEREDIAIKKPGTGIPSREIENFIGKTLSRDLQRNEVFQKSDFQEARL